MALGTVGNRSRQAKGSEIRRQWSCDSEIVNLKHGDVYLGCSTCCQMLGIVGVFGDE